MILNVQGKNQPSNAASAYYIYTTVLHFETHFLALMFEPCMVVIASMMFEFPHVSPDEFHSDLLQSRKAIPPGSVPCEVLQCIETLS
jgi:hypothetical protein